MFQLPISRQMSAPSRGLAAGLGALVLASALAMTPARADGERSPAPAMITISGEGTATLVPDAAVLTLSVVTPGDNAPEALDANSRQLTAIVETLKAAGLDERDLQTSGFSINPRYADRRDDPNAPLKIIGYEVRNGLSVRVRDLTRLSGVLDEVVKAGANEMGGISFQVSDREAALNDARKAAVKDARAKAELYAQAAGVRLGRLVMISEMGSGSGPVPMFKAEMAMMRADVPVQAGEESLSASVTLQFELVQD